MLLAERKFCSILTFRKEPGTSFLQYLEYDFPKKMFLMLYSIKCHCLIAFTFSDIGQYVYRSY